MPGKNLWVTSGSPSCSPAHCWEGGARCHAFTLAAAGEGTRGGVGQSRFRFGVTGGVTASAMTAAFPPFWGLLSETTTTSPARCHPWVLTHYVSTPSHVTGSLGSLDTLGLNRGGSCSPSFVAVSFQVVYFRHAAGRVRGLQAWAHPVRNRPPYLSPTPWGPPANRSAGKRCGEPSPVLINPLHSSSRFSG